MSGDWIWNQRTQSYQRFDSSGNKLASVWNPSNWCWITAAGAYGQAGSPEEAKRQADAALAAEADL